MLTALSQGRVPIHYPGMKLSTIILSSLALVITACGGVEPGQTDEFEASTAEARTANVTDSTTQESDHTTVSAAPTAQNAVSGASTRLYPGPRGYESSKVACDRDPGCSYGIWTCGNSPSTGQPANCCCNYH